MKTFTLATLSGLVAVVLAAAVPEEASSSLAKKADDTIYITLCNDFHGGKPCEKKPITPGKCSTSKSSSRFVLAATRYHHLQCRDQRKRKRKRKKETC